jgi:formyl-CoA transferase
MQGEHPWRTLLEGLDRTDLLDDPRFATLDLRHRNADAVDELMAEWMSRHTKMEAMEILGRHGVAAGAVLTVAELTEDMTLRDSGMLVPIDHPVHGRAWLVGWPLRMSDSHVALTQAPRVGEHNEEIYGDMLGIPAAELDRLHAAGVI